MYFIVELIEVGDKGNFVLVNFGDNIINVFSEEISFFEGRSFVGCFLEIYDSSNMVEKKVIFEFF